MISKRKLAGKSSVGGKMDGVIGNICMCDRKLHRSLKIIKQAFEYHAKQAEEPRTDIRAMHKCMSE